MSAPDTPCMFCGQPRARCGCGRVPKAGTTDGTARFSGRGERRWLISELERGSMNLYPWQKRSASAARHVVRLPGAK